mmetsp:Transcript_56241/g.150238  ORF Transcript_56241/g.150238 Transcript_56241/m.150238 type:complete len:249 (-) Transcript_56241:45-791(-)
MIRSAQHFGRRAAQAQICYRRLAVAQHTSRAPRVLQGDCVSLASCPRTLMRCMASYTKPRELHRHRKRLEGFGKGAQKGDEKVLADCHKLLQDTDWFARKTAVDVIGQVANRGSAHELKVLCSYLEDSDIFVREATVDAIAATANPGDTEIIGRLAMRLVDEDCFVRTRAVVALGLLGEKGDQQTMDLLDEMFEDGFVPTRKHSIEALLLLANPGDEKAIKKLLPLVKRDSDEGVRRDARKAIEQLKG